MIVEFIFIHVVQRTYCYTYYLPGNKWYYIKLLFIMCVLLYTVFYVDVFFIYCYNHAIITSVLCCSLKGYAKKQIQKPLKKYKSSSYRRFSFNLYWYNYLNDSLIKYTLDFLVISFYFSTVDQEVLLQRAWLSTSIQTMKLKSNLSTISLMECCLISWMTQVTSKIYLRPLIIQLCS